MRRVIITPNRAEVSVPGVDVMTASIGQMLFSHRFRSPRVVSKGEFVSNVGTGNGNTQTSTTRNFGVTLPRIPLVIGIAKASSHLLYGFSPNPRSQYTYLDNQWHTFALELPGGSMYSNLYHAGGQASYFPAGHVFASIKFMAQVFTDRVVFTTNCSSPVTIRYAVMAD